MFILAGSPERTRIRSCITVVCGRRQSRRQSVLVGRRKGSYSPRPEGGRVGTYKEGLDEQRFGSCRTTCTVRTVRQAAASNRGQQLPQHCNKWLEACVSIEVKDHTYVSALHNKDSQRILGVKFLKRVGWKYEVCGIAIG